jgi:hypothetical protein
MQGSIHEVHLIGKYFLLLYYSRGGTLPNYMKLDHRQSISLLKDLDAELCDI